MRPTRLLLALLLLGGCAARDHLPDYSAQAGKALPATWYDAVIIARDGTRLSATVFQPALAVGKPPRWWCTPTAGEAGGSPDRTVSTASA